MDQDTEGLFLVCIHARCALDGRSAPQLIERPSSNYSIWLVLVIEGEQAL